MAVTGGFGRRSDREFVKAVADAGHLDLDLLDTRIDQLPDTVTRAVRGAAQTIIQGLR